MSAVLESEIKLTERSDEIRAALDHLLESHCFRNSRRNVRFLRVIVGKTLGGQAHEIKERTLGVEVFDRAPEYDLSSDPIVRVAAGDIRKRLAQYYEEEGKHATIRLRLPLGTYVPEFVSLSKQADVEPPEARDFQLPVSHAEAPAEELPPPPEKGSAAATSPENGIRAGHGRGRRSCHRMFLPAAARRPPRTDRGPVEPLGSTAARLSSAWVT